MQLRVVTREMSCMIPILVPPFCCSDEWQTWQKNSSVSGFFLWLYVGNVGNVHHLLLDDLLTYFCLFMHFPRAVSFMLGTIYPNSLTQVQLLITFLGSRIHGFSLSS